MTEPSVDSKPGALSLERIVFFSDAVFAIAITLLALEIRLPASLGENPINLNQAILDLAPKLFGYTISFAVIGLYWLAHWRRFGLIDRANEGLAAVNLVLLGFIALIPFPTALLGDHGDQPGPVVVYAVVLSCAGIAGTVSWLYAIRSGLATPHDQVAARLGILRGLTVPVVFLASLPLLVVGPYLVEASWLLILPVQYLVVRWIRRSATREPAAPDAASKTPAAVGPVASSEPARSNAHAAEPAARMSPKRDP